MKRICKECGLEFETKSSRALYCKGIHYRTCVVCGQQFPVNRDQLVADTKCCSKKCTSIAKRQGAASRKFQCVCSICGKTFIGKNANSRVCADHNSLICEYCGKSFPASHEEIVRGKRTCSDRCRYLLAQKHTDKSAAMESYRRTIQARYGVDNPMRLSQIAEAAVQTKRERYGDNLQVITDHIQSTLQDRYGISSPMQSSEFKRKAQQTCMDKYGVDNYAKSTRFLLDVIIDETKADNYTSFKSDPSRFIESQFDHKPTLAELADTCGVRDSSMGWYINQHHLDSLVAYTFSRMEDEVYQFLRSCVPDAIIIRNTFQVITPYELDLYLPEYQLAIECNPTVTHNSTLAGFSNDEPKSRSYHMMKTDMCDNKHIFLFHIFGYEWTHRKEVIQSMLASLLNVSGRRIYARNTEVVHLTDRDCISFLNENHRQGGAHSKVRLGLLSDDELVAAMTFSKMRPTIGVSSNMSADCWELVRFCNKRGTNVVGGASKLFKHFLDAWSPIEIRSFSDRAHTRGRLYETLGFQYDHTSDPGYVWVNLKTDQAVSRNSAQKRNVAKLFNKPDIDLSKSETQIMAEHGYVQVFDSGVKLWRWLARG